jgi:hypothetical protein
MRPAVTRVFRAAGVCLLLAACHAQAPLPAPAGRFANFTRTCGDIPRNRGGIPGEIPRAYLDEYIGRQHTTTARRAGSPTGSGYDADALIDGLCTWYLWEGGDPASYDGRPNTGGNPVFWRAVEQKSAAAAEATKQPITFTLLHFIDSRRRRQRFHDLGVINDPGCAESTQPDAYGLYLDRCSDPYDSGIIGIRLSPNPKFDRRHWDASAYFKDPRKYEPPYLAGMTCGACHVAFNPLRPPADPENPKWENLTGAIGNQYLREGKLFEAGLKPENFLWHLYATQEPGTSDTSRLSVDWIDNPSAINPIGYIDSARPKFTETMNDGTTAAVPHILKDGADSVGAVHAAMRVYVNEGLCSAMRMADEDVLLGIGRDQTPFRIADAAHGCQDWQQTAPRMVNVARFLDSQHRYPLADVDGGSYVSGDAAVLATGRRAFAENCARCHSSKVPQGLDAVTKHDRANAPKWVELVDRSDFFDDNFLSDDNRYPIVSADWRFAIGTNSKRALGTNAGAGHIWNDFSSKTYKELPSPGSVHLYNPLDPSKPIDFHFPEGKGYYRVPSLIGVWATAPLLHNNALGVRTDDPSVAGRLRAFEEAMDEMFHPDRRRGVRSIKRTTVDSTLPLGRVTLRIPAGTPVDLIANIDFRALVAVGRTDVASMSPLQVLTLNKAPDFIEDGGHQFGSRLTSAEQRALIEFMKTF